MCTSPRARFDAGPNDVARQAERRPPARHLWRSPATGAVPEPGATAIELRSADFSPLPRRPGETAGGGLKSALLLAGATPNSTAVEPGAPGAVSRCASSPNVFMPMDREAGQASSLRRSAKPRANLSSCSRSRARRAGQTPALRWVCVRFIGAAVHGALWLRGIIALITLTGLWPPRTSAADAAAPAFSCLIPHEAAGLDLVTAPRNRKSRGSRLPTSG